MVNQGHIAKFYVAHKIMDDNIDNEFLRDPLTLIIKISNAIRKIFPTRLCNKWPKFLPP